MLYAGWPDLLVVAPDGVTTAVELKDFGDRVRPNQAAMHEALRAAGVRVEVIDFGKYRRLVNAPYVLPIRRV